MRYFILPLIACAATATAAPLPEKVLEGFAGLALECVHREYPNKIAHVMGTDADAQPPRQLTPAFFGCYDWHSSVHGHWLLVRAVRTHPDAAYAAAAREALARSLRSGFGCGRRGRRRGGLGRLGNLGQ